MHSKDAQQQQYIHNKKKVNEDKSRIIRSEMSVSLGPLHIRVKKEEVQNNLKSVESVGENLSSTKLQMIKEVHQEQQKLLELKSKMSGPALRVYNTYKKIDSSPSRIIDIKA